MNLAQLLFAVAFVLAGLDALSAPVWWKRLNRTAAAVALVALGLAFTGTGFSDSNLIG